MPPTGTIFYNDVNEVNGQNHVTARFPTSQSTGSALSELPLKMSSEHEDTPEGIALERRVGLVSGVALIVGTMIELNMF